MNVFRFRVFEGRLNRLDDLLPPPLLEQDLSAEHIKGGDPQIKGTVVAVEVEQTQSDPHSARFERQRLILCGGGRQRDGVRLIDLDRQQMVRHVLGVEGQQMGNAQRQIPPFGERMPLFAATTGICRAPSF